jgi:hypothetical protein
MNMLCGQNVEFLLSDLVVNNIDKDHGTLFALPDFNHQLMNVEL